MARIVKHLNDPVYVVDRHTEARVRAVFSKSTVLEQLRVDQTTNHRRCKALHAGAFDLLLNFQRDSLCNIGLKTSLTHERVRNALRIESRYVFIRLAYQQIRVLKEEYVLFLQGTHTK